MKVLLHKLFVRLKLKFKSPIVEANYHILMQPFNDLNFASFLILLLAGQLGFMAVKILEGSISFPILIGVTVLINIFLLKNRKKLYKTLEIFTAIFMVFLYTLGTIDLKNRVQNNSTKTEGLFIFFEGYLLCLAHQLFLRYFIQYTYVFVFDIGVMIMRSIIFAPLFYEGGFPYPYLIHLFFDLAILQVSYRKEVTVRGLFEQLHNQKEELTKFKSLMVDSMPESIIILHTSLTRELFTNQAFKKALRNGSHAGDFVQDLSKTYVMKESLQSLPHSVILDEVINRNSVVSLHEFLHIGTKGKLFDEGVFIIHGTSTPPDAIRTPLGRRTYEIKIFRLSWDSEDALVINLNDITHREKLVALKVSDINKDKVLASVTHELKTPLNGIYGMIQIMQKKVTDSEMLQHLNALKTNSDLLLHYINSILDLQLIRKRKLKLRVTKVEIRELITEIIGLFTFQCQQKGIGLMVDIGDSVPKSFHTDRNRLIGVLVHLLNNAVKFTYHGRVLVKVSKNEPSSSEIRFSVQDTGIGMSEDEKVRLFKMFGTVDSGIVNTRGVGVGLTTSNGLVLKLKGDRSNVGIEVESVANAGSKFSFTHPLDLLEIMNTHVVKTSVNAIPQDEDDDTKFYLIVNRAEDKTGGEILLKNKKVQDPKYRFDDESDEFEELEVGDEVYIDEGLQRFLSMNGLSVVQERVKRYKTKKFGNLFKWNSPESMKTSFMEDAPLSQRSLIKVPVGMYQETSPINSGKLRRKNTGMVPNVIEKNDTIFDYTESLLKVNSRGVSVDDKTFMRNFSDLNPNKSLLNSDNQKTSPFTAAVANHAKRMEKYQTKLSTYKSIITKEEPRQTVLVVDDMPFNVMVVKELIEGAGLEVQTAMNGQQAIEKVKEHYLKNKSGFKFILMDLQMPVMDGFEASKSLVDLMEKKEIPSTPIIALTANDSDENLEKCIECGMKTLLPKPFKAVDLEKLIKRFSTPSQEC